MSSSKPKMGFSMSLSGGGGGGKRKGTFKKKGSDDTKKSPAEMAMGQNDDDDNDGDSSREMVTAIGGGKVVTAAPEKYRGPLVIGLTRNHWEDDNKKAAAAAAAAAAARGTAGSSSPSSGTTAVPAGAAKEKSLDQLAAEAIALESRPEASEQGTKDNNDRYGLGLNSDRVIGMVPVVGKDGRGGGGGQGNDGTGAGGAAASLLAQSMIPGIAEMDGDDAKFKHDLGYRAEDLSVRSQAYQDVPIHEFGAALLRGMGWSGQTGNDGDADGSNNTRDVVPRHQRLGLGAQPKPPEEMKKLRKRRPGEKPKALEKDALELWQRKAKEEEKRQASKSQSQSQLSVMDIVVIAENGESSSSSPVVGKKKQRAMVMKTQGVPGLNKIEVRLEHTGERTYVDKSSVTKISEDEKAKFPFSASKRDSGGAGDGYGDGDGGSNGRRVASSKGEGERNGNAGGHRKRNRSRSRSRSTERGNGDGGASSDKSRGDKKSKRSKKEKDSKKEKKRDKRQNGNHRNGGSRHSSGSDNEFDPRPTGNNYAVSSSSKRNSSNDSPSSKYSPRRNDTSDDQNAYRQSSRGDTSSRRAQQDGRSSSVNGTATGDPNERGGDGSKRGAANWLRPNIRVRVVHKGYSGGRAYRCKGRVIDVPRPGEATVRMDSGSLVLEGVKQRHLETVVPGRGGKVIVVRGSERGATGKLLARDKEKETALVQVYEDLRALTLSLDDVAEFTGMLDDDVDDAGY